MNTPSDLLTKLAAQFRADMQAILEQQAAPLELPAEAVEPEPRTAGTVKRLIEAPALIEEQPEPTPDAGTVKADPELMRLAIAMRQFVPFRVWLYAHDRSDGSGRILRERLLGAFQVRAIKQHSKGHQSHRLIQPLG